MGALSWSGLTTGGGAISMEGTSGQSSTLIGASGGTGMFRRVAPAPTAKESRRVEDVWPGGGLFGCNQGRQVPMLVAAVACGAEGD